MKTLIIAWLKANWLAVGKRLLAAADWAGILARVFSYLLRLALQSGRYAAVRLLASRVIEQARIVLAVTDDGVVLRYAAQVPAGAGKTNAVCLRLIFRDDALTEITVYTMY